MGWRFKNISLGRDAVVFPDTPAEAEAFSKALGRPVSPSDKASWVAHAERLNIPRDEVDSAWARMSTRGGVSEALAVLASVFEASASGSWMPHPMLTKMRHGPPGDEPSPEPTPPSAKSNIAAAPPSFPFHTKVSRNIYNKSLKLIGLYPLEGPRQILRRAIMAAGATPLVDITPEDEKLLYMAIDLAQNGPAQSKGNKIGGMPGGPLNPIRDETY